MAQSKTGSEARLAFFVAVGLVTVASLLDTAAVSWAVAPIVIVLGVFAIFRAPLSDTMLALMFMALTLENPAERPGAGFWQSPFYTFGGLVLTHFKNTIGWPLPFGGMDVMLISAIAVAYLRRNKRSAAERAVATPRIMVKLAYLSLGTVGLVFIVGKLRGNADASMAVWQADRVTYLPIVFLLCASAFNGPKDHLRVGKVLLAAGALRASQAIFVKLITNVPPDPETGETGLVYATTHNDSITFALTTVLLAALLIERVDKKMKRLVLLVLPILLGGMLANNRRMVWLQIMMVLATVYLMTERNKIKRRIERVLTLLSPLALGYVLVGWESQAKIFKPVQVIRSAVDSKTTDSSTLWREIENYDLISTFRQYPIFGLGYGHPFWEIMPLPAVDYTLERYIPHNSLLGMWCFYGLVGFAGLTSLWVAGVFFGIRAYHYCKDPLERAAALVCFASVLVYFVQCFGDIGLGCWAGVFTVGPLLAIACKLAVRSGAWVEVAPRGKVRAGSRARSAAAAARPSGGV